jgi:hypothetical protein
VALGESSATTAEGRQDWWHCSSRTNQRIKTTRTLPIESICFNQEDAMLWWILLIILIVVLLAALPTWGYSSGWGYYPSGLLAILVVIILVLLLIGVL